MQIEVKGRNVAVTDELREHVEKRFDKVGKQVSELARLEVELCEERNPAIAERAGRRGDAPPQGRRRCARSDHVARHAPRDQPLRGRARAPGQAPPRQAPQARDARRRAARRPRPASPGDRAAAADGPRRGAAGASRRRRRMRPARCYTQAHGYSRPRAEHRRGQAVPRVREARRRDRRLRARARSSSPTTSCASASTRCASASATSGEPLDDVLPEMLRDRRARPAGARWACATSTCS